MEIKIMEWNINQRLGITQQDMPKWIADVIAEKKADIIALTEVYKGNNWESIKNNAFNSDYAVFETFNHSARQNDVAIAINTNKLDVVYEKAFFPSTEGIPDHLEVKIKTKEKNEEFIFICIRIHALVTDEIKRQELQCVLDSTIDNDKVVICGDFNNFRRGCPARKWCLSEIEKICKESQFDMKTPDGSSIYEENKNNPAFQFPEDHFLLKGINDTDFTLLPYYRDFVINDNTVYKWGKDFKKYVGKDKKGKSIYDSVPSPFPDHAILEGLIKI